MKEYLYFYFFQNIAEMCRTWNSLLLYNKGKVMEHSSICIIVVLILCGTITPFGNGTCMAMLLYKARAGVSPLELQ